MSIKGKKTQLVPVISFLLIAGFLLTSLVSYFVSVGSLRSKISDNELPLTSDNIYSEIQRDLLRPVFISSTMATDTFVRDWVLNGEQNPELMIKYLNEIKQKYDTFTSFFVSDKSLNYYHANQILKKVSTYEARDAWYFRVKYMKDDYEINIDPDMANKDAMTIFINYKVFDYDKNYIGATGVGLTIKAVKQLIEEYQEKYNRTIYFFNPDGNIELTGATFNQSITNISELGYYSLIKNDLHTTTTKSFSYRNNRKLVHTNIRYIDEFKWYLVVEQPDGEAIREIFKTLIINLSICSLITLIVLILVQRALISYKERIETLRGIVPICSFCKQIRDDKGYWNRVEEYISEHTEAEFSHSICPDCMKEHYPNENFDKEEG
ncbi:MAG: cache domain-containing protein [Kiritimatiellae bacterium]|jgi:hypothetical protein|nr:cache domain-containing protein [Kiritimatiellia bacterium]